MTAQPHPLGTGFGPRTTARDTLAGVDLSRRVALVTGGYSGIGLETTRALSDAGAHVIVPARRPATARQAVADIANATVDELDLADPRSIRRFAERQLATGASIDIVIANAGVMAIPKTRLGPGWEGHFAVNHLGHYTLINLLWPAIAHPGARLVAVSSAGHHLSDIRWDDIHFNDGYDKWLAYGQSKTANVLFAVALDRRGRGQGVTAVATHPGSILTPLQRHMTIDEMVQRRWTDETGRGIDPSFKTPEQGAATQTWAATTPRFREHGGVYCEDCDIADVATSGESDAGGVSKYAIDESSAERLWTLSADMTNVDAFGAG